jgi:hypothetical protein
MQTGVDWEDRVALRERSADLSDVHALSWKVKRFRALTLYVYPLQRGLDTYRPTGRCPVGRRRAVRRRTLRQRVFPATTPCLIAGRWEQCTPTLEDNTRV